MAETFQGRAITGRGDAASIAIQVLNFIVLDIDRIIQFLNITGLQPETIREAAASSHFLLVHQSVDAVPPLSRSKLFH